MKVEVQTLTCLRCGHKWTPRQAEVRICPNCKSAYWDTPRPEVNVDITIHSIEKG